MSDCDQAKIDCCAQAGALAQEHVLLKPFVGTFKATVTMWMGPGEPMVSTGTMTNTLVLGDRFLCHDYKGDATDGPFPHYEGKGYWGFNTGTGKFEGLWIDSASTGLQTDAGTVDHTGKVWTMLGSMLDPQSGNPIPKQSTITLHSDDTHTMEMSFQSPDGSWQRCIKIDYQRI